MTISDGGRVKTTTKNGESFRAAAAREELDRLKKLPDNKKLDALQKAVKAENVDAIKLLTAAGADPNQLSGGSRMAYAYSTSTGKAQEVFHALLDGGLNPMGCDNDGELGLFRAAMQHKENFTKMLECGATPLKRSGNYVSVVDKILGNGSVDQKREYILAMVVKSQRYRDDIITYVVKNSNLYESTDDIYRALLAHSLKQNQPFESLGGLDAAKLMVIAVKSGAREFLSEAIEVYGYKDEPDDNGWTALHHAAKTGHFRILWDLLKAGADPNILDNEGYSVLDVLAEYNNAGGAAERLLKSEYSARYNLLGFMDENRVQKRGALNLSSIQSGAQADAQPDTQPDTQPDAPAGTTARKTVSRPGR